jgi:hypothetical protein
MAANVSGADDSDGRHSSISSSRSFVSNSTSWLAFSNARRTSRLCRFHRHSPAKKQEFVSGPSRHRAFLSYWNSMVPVRHIESKTALLDCGRQG